MILIKQKGRGGYWFVERDGKVTSFGWATSDGAEGYALREYPGERVVVTTRTASSHGARPQPATAPRVSVKEAANG